MTDERSAEGVEWAECAMALWPRKPWTWHDSHEGGQLYGLGPEYWYPKEVDMNGIICTLLDRITELEDKVLQARVLTATTRCMACGTVAAEWERE